jgi:hypothetical protein
MKGSHVVPWILASAVVMVVGAVGPWAKAFGLTINGLDGDGTIILILGILAIVAGAIVARTSKRPRPRWPYIVCAIAGLLGAAIALYDWGSLEGVVDSTALSDAEEDLVAAAVSAGWGIVLAAIAGVSLTVASVAGFVGRKGETPVAAPVAVEEAA